MQVEEYEKMRSECDGLCEIDPDRIDPEDGTKMPCVMCPFCKEIVTAILTPTSITCPNCKAHVHRN